MMLVANAWREHVLALHARDRAISRLSTISQEARAQGLTDPQCYPAELFTRWLRAITAVGSWHRLECVTFGRHSRLERCFRHARLRECAAR